MNFFKLLNHYKYVILTLILTFFLLGYFVTEYFYNSNCARYIYYFSCDDESKVEEIITPKYFDTVFEEISNYNLTAEKKITYAIIDYKELLKTAKLEKNQYYEFSFLKKYFPNTIKTSNGLVNESSSRALKYFNLIFSYSDAKINNVEFKLVNYQNPFIIGGISSLVFTGCILVFILIKKDDYVEIEDNDTIFKSIFHKKYWKNTLDWSKKVKNLCVVSLLFALMLLCKLIPIPSGFGSLGIGFTYLIFATIALIYGPICGIFIGFCSDILGFFLFQGGQVFFPGYTLDAMLTGFIYGVCFYKKRISFTNCLFARFLVNIFINVLCGSFWWKIIYNLNFEQYMVYLSLTSLPKNVLYLLPQSILLFLVFKAISKPLVRFGFIEEKIAKNIKLF